LLAALFTAHSYNRMLMSIANLAFVVVHLLRKPYSSFFHNVAETVSLCLIGVLSLITAGYYEDLRSFDAPVLKLVMAMAIVALLLGVVAMFVSYCRPTCCDSCNYSVVDQNTVEATPNQGPSASDKAPEVPSSSFHIGSSPVSEIEILPVGDSTSTPRKD
jgi:hypothetical protein